MKKVLLTGGAGFIGSHIAETYLNKGYKVVVIDNLSSGKKKNIPSKAKFYKIDILNKNIIKVIKEENPDIINHHAAHINAVEAVEKPLKDGKINVLGLLNILEGAKNTNVKRIIFASSGGAICGETKKAANESILPKPLSPYGINKLIGEFYIKNFSDRLNIPSICLRYSNVYGPRQRADGEGGVVAIFTKNMLKNKKVKIYGDGKQTRDFVYVKDVAEANILATESNKQGIFNISKGEDISVNDLFNKIAKICNYNLKPEYAEKRKGDIKYSCLDNKKAKNILNWQAETSLDKGLRETVQFFS